MRLERFNFWGILLVFLISVPVHANFGNWFIANKRISHVLNAATQKISYRFTCQENMTLSAVAVYCTQAVMSPAYLVSLQEDHDGKPSGIALSSYYFVPKTQSWTTIPLNEIPLIQNRVYDLVIKPDMLRGGGHPVAVIGKSNYASFLTTDVLNRMQPNDGSPDPHSNSLFFEHGKWHLLNQQPVYAIFGLGNQSQGNPYDDPGVCPIYGNTFQGEALHFHCPCKVTSVVVRVKKQGHPTTPLTFSVLINDYMAHKSVPYYSEVAATANQISSSTFQWVTIGIPLPVCNGFRAECWYFVLQSASGESSPHPPGCTNCYLISDVGNSGGLAGAADLTFEGGPHLSRAVYSTDNGSPYDWIDEFERDSNIGAICSPCPPPPSPTFAPIPTPIPLGDEPQFSP